MNRWSALAVLLVFAGALAIRLPRLDTRPLHTDEAVNAITAVDLWQDGHYRYNPDEHHGPTLHYATLPFLWFSGAEGANDLKDRTLRLAPVAFGAGLILLLLLFADGIGRHALIWAALFTAISPAMVFYSRYFIHEQLLVFFTALALGAGWRYTQTRSPLWAVVAGAGLGLMSATKETFVLNLAAIAVAGIVTAWWMMPKSARVGQAPPPVPAGAPPAESGEPFSVTASAQNRPARHWPGQPGRLPYPALTGDIAFFFTAAFVIWLLFFSSFFTNFAGLLDSVLTYFPWLKRAAGHSPHIHPWYFYLQRLAWFHPVIKGPTWSEGLILLLAVAGAISAFKGTRSPLLRFLALYTMVLTTLYSAISYKTPWCLLGFYHGMILLAGVGAAALLESFRSRARQFALLAVLVAFSVQLATQAWRASVVYSTDQRNPYVYAQTVPDILNLVQRAEGLARVSPAGFETVLKVIAPESDYWPLPWSLRRFEHIGWYDKLPDDPFAPIIIASSKLDARLDDKSGRKWLMAGLFELRPRRFFELYVELELWKKYVETLPPEPD